MNHPQLYGSGQREEKYNFKLFIGFMLDSLWQSLVIFFLPFFAYRHSDVDWSGLGDLWLLGVVILVNLDLAVDVIRWNWITHAAIWGSIAATLISVIIIDSLWWLPGFWYVFLFSCLILLQYFGKLFTSLFFNHPQMFFYVQRISIVLTYSYLMDQF